MKVCTDACLFGAWVAEKIQKSKVKSQNILDVGSGTGLLSLLLAQKLNNTNIDAVEIDEAASVQAKENFEASLWKERLNVANTSIQNFVDFSNSKYDLIISNPPFYENELQSDNAKRNLALHSKELNLEELIIIADLLLRDDGSFFVMLPYYRNILLEKLAARQNLFVKEKVFIKQTPNHNYFRSMFWLTRQQATAPQSEIIIMNDENKYSDEFINLLKDYYLYL